MQGYCFETFFNLTRDEPGFFSFAWFKSNPTLVPALKLLNLYWNVKRFNDRIHQYSCPRAVKLHEVVLYILQKKMLSLFLLPSYKNRNRNLVQFSCLSSGAWAFHRNQNRNLFMISIFYFPSGVTAVLILYFAAREIAVHLFVANKRRFPFQFQKFSLCTLQLR